MCSSGNLSIGGAIGGTVGAVLTSIAAVGTSIAIPGLSIFSAGPIAAHWPAQERAARPADRDVDWHRHP